MLQSNFGILEDSQGLDPCGKDIAGMKLIEMWY